MVSHLYTCDADAEPIHRYRPGGYHPVSLGDELKGGRYKSLHKVSGVDTQRPGLLETRSKQRLILQVSNNGIGPTSF